MPFLAGIRSACTNLVALRLLAPPVPRLAAESMPISDPSTSTNEGETMTSCLLPCSPKKLHQNSRSATASHSGARTHSISGYRSGPLHLYLLPPNQNSRLWMYQSQTRTASFVWSDVFVPLTVTREELLREVDRVDRVRRVEHRSVDRRMAEPWNQVKVAKATAVATPNLKNGSCHRIALSRCTVGTCLGIL